MWTLPNILTLARIAVIPLLVVVFYLDWKWAHIASAALFGAAAITDWIDGYLARKWNQMTPFGAFLDPVADKLIVATSLLLLLEQYASVWFVLPTMVIIGREIGISALREWMAELGSRSSVAVSMLGKVKTWAQMIAIVVLLAFEPSSKFALLGYIALYIAAMLTLWSMIYYLRMAWPQLKATNNPDKA